jgi:RNA polymerase sigma factor (sigma-70 family)
VKSTDADRRATFEQLFRETRADLLTYALRRAVDAEDAADVLAETYLIAWKKIDVLPKGERKRLWLFGVARNVLLRGASQQRYRSRLGRHLASELHRAGGAVGPAVEHELVAALRAGLSSLSPRDREIVTLTAWEGLTPRQIATVLGTSPNAVRIRLHRARTQLKRELALRHPDAGSRGPIAIDADSRVA